MNFFINEQLLEKAILFDVRGPNPYVRLNDSCGESLRHLASNKTLVYQYDAGIDVNTGVVFQEIGSGVLQRWNSQGEEQERQVPNPNERLVVKIINKKKVLFVKKTVPAHKQGATGAQKKNSFIKSRTQVQEKNTHVIKKREEKVVQK